MFNAAQGQPRVPICWEVAWLGLPEVDASLTISDGLPDGSHVKNLLCLVSGGVKIPSEGGLKFPKKTGTNLACVVIWISPVAIGTR